MAVQLARSIIGNNGKIIVSAGGDKVQAILDLGADEVLFFIDINSIIDLLLFFKFNFSLLFAI